MLGVASDTPAILTGSVPRAPPSFVKSQDLCSTYREELEQKHGISDFETCVFCVHPAASHPRQPKLVTSVSASSSFPTSSSGSMPGSAVLKRLIDMCPKWGKSSVCRTFLERVEQVLQLADDNGECTKAHWPTVLVYLMPASDPDAGNWVRQHIVLPKLDWAAAKLVFTAHFQLADRSVTLRLELQDCRQAKGESVQAYADRYVNLLVQLGRKKDDEWAIEKFLDHLSTPIRDKYDEHLLTVRAMPVPSFISADPVSGTAAKITMVSNRDFAYTTLDEIIAICIEQDVHRHTKALRGGSSAASASASGAASSAPSSASSKASHTTAGGDKKKERKHCINHPGMTGHSTAECRLGKPASASGGVSSSASRTEVTVKAEPMSATCFVCGKLGHLATNCPQKAAGQTPAGTAAKAEFERRTSARIAAQKAAGVNVNVTARSVYVDEAKVSASGSDANSGPAPAMRTTMVLDRALPSAVFVPSASEHSVWFLFREQPYVTLFDTGCNVSCIDAALAAELKLPITAMPGEVKLAHANTSVKRIGRTAPLSVTAVFPVPGLDKEPVVFVHSFEVMPLESGYQFILGADLIRQWFPTSIPSVFLPGPPKVSPLDAPKLSRAVISREDDMVPLEQLDDAERQSAEHELDLSIDALSGFGTVPIDEFPIRSAISTAPELVDLCADERARIMADPDIQQAIAINADVTGFCNLSQSIVRLEIDPAKKGKLFRKQYPIAHALRHRVTEVVDRWFASGKIELAPVGCEYNNPLTVAPKRDEQGGMTGIRVCLDTRMLNAALMQQDRFQLPYIRDALELFAGNTIFGEFDLQEAYLQFRMDEESKQYTAFTWNGVQYVFVGAPFGIAMLPSHFQRIMSVALSDLSFTFPYLDNLPFGSRSWDEHRDQALIIITRLNQLNLKIKPSSIKFGYSQIRCLGHQLSANGVSIDPDKLKALADWPRPVTGKELMSFLGFAVFLRQHVRHFSEITGPLEAVKNNKEIEWTDELCEAFELTKQALATAPFLHFPDFSRPFHIATDASNTGVGGVLYQPDSDDGDITATNIVAICSKKLSKSQRNYPAYKKELFGIVYCLRQFHSFVWGRSDLVLHTDHKPLTYMFQSELLSPALQQWLDVILDYSFEIRYRPGVFNVLPDALSREHVSQYKTGVWGIPASVRSLPAAHLVSDGDGLPPALDSASAPVMVRAASADNELVPAPSLPGEGDASASNSDSDSKVDAAAYLAIQMELRGKTRPASHEARLALIEQEHLFGHFGREALFKALYNKGYWWPHMRTDILSVLASCDACTRFVVTKRGFHPAQFITADGPWDHIQIDCKVHLPVSKDGYTALLVILDVFTGFIQLRPIITTSAEVIARELWSVFCILGLPKILQSDNGPEFANDIIRALVKLNGIEHRFITPYNPRADGKVERSIQTVMASIKKLLQGSYDSWPLLVPSTQLAFNCKVASLTGSTPFSLMFGRSLNDIKDYTDVPSGSEVQPVSVSLSNWKAHQEKVLSLIYPAISARVRISKEAMIKTLDKHRKQLLPGAFPNGARVMLLDPEHASGIKNKLEAKYIGPYTVIRRSRNGAYVLKDDTGEILERRAPADHLKLVSRKARPIDLEDRTFEVQSILGHRGQPDAYEYRVQWKDHNDRTWEPASAFLDDLVIRNYWKALRENAGSNSDPAASASASLTSQSAAISPVSAPRVEPLSVSRAAASAVAAVDAALASVREVASAAAGRGNSVALAVVGDRGAGGSGSGTSLGNGVALGNGAGAKRQ
jgi:hypothetical protein